MPSPATAPSHAQSIAPAAFDKSEAILGGPSSLAAILAAQSTSAPLQALAASLPMRYAIARPAPVFPLAMPADANPIELAASPTHPDIFNSVAMAVTRTPLDDRWSRVGSASVGGHAARFAAALRGRDERTRLDAVNAYVNARVTFTEDSRQYGVADRWSTASETLARGRGDCEDYALAKRAMLRRAGIEDRNLYFVVLRT